MLYEVITPIRQFLLQTAILQRLTAPLCDAVTGKKDGQEVLTYLGQANLFLIALDNRREWYRYHHLRITSYNVCYTKLLRLLTRVVLPEPARAEMRVNLRVKPSSSR